MGATLRPIGRAFLWMLGGAVAGTIVDAVGWTHDGTQAADQTYWALVAIGAAVALGLFLKAPAVLAARAAKAFSLLYCTLLLVWLAKANHAPLPIVALLLTGAVVLLVLGLRAPDRPSITAAELWTAAAAIVWVATVLGLFAMLGGLLFLPLAVSLTIAFRGTRRRAGIEVTARIQLSASAALKRAGAALLAGAIVIAGGIALGGDAGLTALVAIVVVFLGYVLARPSVSRRNLDRRMWLSSRL